MAGEPQTVMQTIKSELSIFDEPTYQTTHLKAMWSKIKPEGNYQGTSGEKVQFTMAKHEGWYYDFNDTFIIIELALTKEDGVTKISDDKVAFINYVGAALFKDMKHLH